MRNRIKWVVGILVVAVVAWGLGAGARYLQVVKAQSIQPYLIKKHIYAVSDDGKKVIEYDAFYARRSDGVTSVGNNQGTVTGFNIAYPNVVMRKVSLNYKGVIFQASDLNSNIVTWGKGEPIPIERHGDCKVYLGAEYSGETKTILGFQAVRGVEHEAIYDEEFWVAPALDCMVVEKTYNWKKNTDDPNPGAYDGITTERASFLSAAEPPDALFAIPTGAVETLPSQYLMSLGISDPSASKLDAKYQSDKQAREAAGVTLTN